MKMRLQKIKRTLKLLQSSEVFVKIKKCQDSVKSKQLVDLLDKINPVSLVFAGSK